MRAVSRRVQAVRSRIGRRVPASLKAWCPPGLPAGELVRRLRLATHPRLYLTQLPERERAELGPDPSIEVTLEHYLTFGAPRDLRICALFSPSSYADAIAATDPIDSSPTALFRHWLAQGWERRIVPTPLFDEEFYRQRHPAVAAQPGWAFEHYLRVGCYEPQWNPSPAGKHHSGGTGGPVGSGEPLLLRQLLHHADDFDLARTSWLEQGVRTALEAADRLAAPEVAALIEHATGLEPLIAASLQQRPAVFCPPYRGPRVHLASVAEDVRRRIGHTRAATIVLVPDAAAAPRSTADALVLGTDRPSDVAAPDHRGFVDLADDLAGFDEVRRLDLLLDVVRGLAPDRIVCAGSAAGAALLEAYGRQLAVGAVLEHARAEAR